MASKFSARLCFILEIPVPNLLAEVAEPQRRRARARQRHLRRALGKALECTGRANTILRNLANIFCWQTFG